MKPKIGLIVLGAVALLTAADASAVNRTGGRADDVLRGTPAADVLFGGGGNDRLIGGRGNDLLAGGQGQDTLLCGSGVDTAVVGGGDTVDPSCEAVVTRAGVRPATDATPPQDEEETDPAGDSAEDEIILAWLFPEDGDPDWTEGIVLFVLGAIGALVTAYLFLGEFLPSMGGKAEYDSDSWDLKAKKAERDKIHEERRALARTPPIADDQLKALEVMSTHLSASIDQIEKRRASERWRLLAVGIPAYVLLGGAFATLFATSLAQALIIGFGWVAVADRLGLKREQKVRDDLREKEIEKLETVAEKRTEEVAKLKATSGEEKRVLEQNLAAAQASTTQLSEQLAETETRAARAESARQQYKGVSDSLGRTVEELREPQPPTVGDDTAADPK